MDPKQTSIKPDSSDDNHLGPGEPKDAQDIAQFVQTLLQQVQDKFQVMSDQILSRIDEMSHRVDDLEHNLNELMQHAGIYDDGQNTQPLQQQQQQQIPSDQLNKQQ